MTSTWLFIDSRHRNRNNYPSPSDFVIPFDQKSNVAYSTQFQDPVFPAANLVEADIVAGTSVNSIILTNPIFDYDNAYNGKYLIFTSGAANGDFYRIIDYDSGTQTVTVAGIFSTIPAIGNTLDIYNAIENFIGLRSNVPQTTQTICCTLQLVSLTLPNIDAVTDNPNVFVTLESGNDKPGRLIVSNNDVAYQKAQFIVPVHDDNTTRDFVYLRSKMDQTYKFRLDSDLKFSVTDMDGVPLVLTDTSSPDAPDLTMNITAKFRVTWRPLRSNM